MEPKVSLTIKDIYSKKFAKDLKGYDADEVDAFLDEIMSDYSSFEKIENGLRARISALEGEKESLQKALKDQRELSGASYEKFRQQEIELATLRQKVEAIKSSSAPTAENIDYLQRIFQLESFIKSLGYDVTTLKPEKGNS